MNAQANTMDDGTEKNKLLSAAKLLADAQLALLAAANVSCEFMWFCFFLLLQDYPFLSLVFSSCGNKQINISNS